MSYKGFTTVQMRQPQRSFFDMSHDKKMTVRMGQLVPIMVQECIPGDTWSISTQMLLRLLPLLAPIYARINVTVHFFKVPNRLLWSEWEDFITTGRLGYQGAGSEPIPPFAVINDVQNTGAAGLLDVSSLADYLGVPRVLDSDPGWTTDHTIDMMPFLAYQKVWFEYYRDRNYVADNVFGIDLNDPVPSGDLASVVGVDFEQFFLLRSRDWSRNDYFTSALPFTQRGAEVLIPMDVSVNYREFGRILNTPDPSGTRINLAAATDNILRGTGTVGVADIDVNIDNIESLENSSVTINDLRSALRLQEWLERNAVGGGRYTETIQAHFDVKPQDYRLQRPEYIGGGILPVKISEVVTTAYSQDETPDTIPPGNLAGHGIAAGNAASLRYYCHEHGFIIGIMSIMPKASYQQGLPRMFKRRSFLDYPWPSFAHLGEQEVHNYEIFMNPASMLQDANGDYTLFGYQSRYADWKFSHSTSHGDFRTTLLFWTLTRTFSSQPVLGSTFVGFEDALQDRIFAVSGNNFLCYVFNKVGVKRALPYYGTPML